MKIVRTTELVPIGRKNTLSILAMSVNLEWQEDMNRWQISVKDYQQITNENLVPGSPLYSYEIIRQEDGTQYKKRIYTADEVNVLFSYFNITILPTDNFTDKFRHVIALANIYENQTKPPYTVNPANLEMVDTATEIAV
jgi:hypothetical protein